MPLITTEETRWLKQIDKRLRQLGGLLSRTLSGSVLAQFVVDSGDPGAPANGETDYANPLLAGKTITIFKNGVGYLTEGVDYSLISGGGFSLIGGGQFATGEKYIVFEV